MRDAQQSVGDNSDLQVHASWMYQWDSTELAVIRGLRLYQKMMKRACDFHQVLPGWSIQLTKRPPRGLPFVLGQLHGRPRELWLLAAPAWPCRPGLGVLILHNLLRRRLSSIITTTDVPSTNLVWRPVNQPSDDSSCVRRSATAQALPPPVPGPP
jgi:hypothetical protein